jgi:predicted TPR repeat methyltransferase
MTVPLFQSSGDLIADRRFTIAQEFLARDDLQGAVDLLEQAVEAAPRFASAWFALGELRARLGRREDAIAAFQQVCALDPEDRLGAGLHLARFGALPAGEMPAAYVRMLFDQYAPRFDHAVTKGLAYRGPALLRDAVEQARAAENRPMRFAHVLDLGCGTGLAGAVFRACAETLVGVDLSPGMVAAARAKNLYERLETGDLLAFVAAEARDGRIYELILAADVFAYLSWLPPVLAATARALAPKGLVAFTVESHAGDDVILGEKLRYAHGTHHVQTAVAGAGLSLLALAPASSRSEAGIPVSGLVVVAKRE